jgi:hypothetical protein
MRVNNLVLYHQKFSAYPFYEPFFGRLKGFSAAQIKCLGEREPSHGGAWESPPQQLEQT